MTEPVTESTQLTTQPKTNELRLAPPRLPYHPAIEERFGIDRGSWKFLTDVLYPTAEEPETIINVLSYCRARNLDVMKKPVHVVSVWDKKRKKMADSVWPAIAEVRITAMRTGEYVGKGRTIFGPEITETLGGIEITYPQSAQLTVYRLVAGVAREFHGEELRWKEFYAKAGRDTLAPNDMWKTKPFKQLAKCAEADALRAAFPEEAGSDSTAEEMDGQEVENLYSPNDQVIGSGVRARLAASTDKPTEGFNAEALEELGADDGGATSKEPIEPPPKGKASKAKPSAEETSPPAPTQADVVAEARQAGYEAAAQGAQDIPPAGLLPPLAAAWTGGYQDKVAEIAAAAAATDVVEPIAAAEPDPTPGWKVREDINGPAQPGVVYLMKGDVPDAKTGRLTNYKDGKAFSSVGAKGALELARYTMHPTTPKTEEPAQEQVGAEAEGFPGDKPAPTEGSSVVEPPPAETENADMVAEDWEPLERHDGPAPRGVEYTLADDEISADDTAQAYEDGEPTRRVLLRDFVTLPEYEAHPLPLEEVEAELVDDTPPLLEKLAKMTAWTPVKAELTPLYGDPEFKALLPEEQEAVRANIWVIVLKIKKAYGDPVDPAEDPSAFRLWCSTQLGLGEEGANAIEGTFRSLKRSALFGNMSPDNQKRLSDLAESFVKRLKG